ncbi:MAG TPA: hypothetical protein VD995_24135 [Azospirillum sp.]|nr:hypothetical protein [Azospirillum sp.]
MAEIDWHTDGERHWTRIEHALVLIDCLTPDVDGHEHEDGTWVHFGRWRFLVIDAGTGEEVASETCLVPERDGDYVVPAQATAERWMWNHVLPDD